MFLILGTPRSGTTVLAQCLNANPALALPHETDFIIPAAFLYQRLEVGPQRSEIVGKLISQSRGFKASLGEFFTQQEIVDTVDRSGGTMLDLLCAIYDEIAQRSKARYGGDKSPNDLAFLRILERVDVVPSPRVKIVHIVRDVRDVVASVSRTNWIAHPVERLPRLWSMSNMQLNVLCRGQLNYCIVRYEDFVADAEGALRRICRHLECEFDHRMLDPQNRHPRYRNVKVHGLLYEPIGTGAVGKYRELLKSEQVESIERQAADAMIEFGYSFASEFGRKYADIAGSHFAAALATV